MDDFRSQLAAHVDAMLAAGVRPVFLVVDLVGAHEIKRTHDAETLDRFRETAAGAVSSVAGDCETFTYGEERLVAVLGDVDRLRSFAMVEKLQRVLPLLAQSFDCPLHPDFDFIEYDERTGVAGLLGPLARQLKRDAA
jgi:hypothetical protein